MNLKGLSMKLPSILAACLFTASAAFAQAPQEAPKAPAAKSKAERRHHDCSQAKDPKACEERRAKLKAAHDKATKACEGKERGERRECMRREMCSQAKDPKACEERTGKVKSAASKARQACEGKQGNERRECMRREMCAQAKDPAKCEAQWKERAEKRSAPKQQ
jgi:Spy/CpxP family protein refolding chaperone